MDTLTPADLKTHQAILPTALDEVLRADRVIIRKSVISAGLPEIVAAAKVMLRSRSKCPTPAGVLVNNDLSEEPVP